MSGAPSSLLRALAATHPRRLVQAPVVGDGETIRLACSVPFCGRTFRNDKKGTPWGVGHRVMCGKHWRMGSKVLRRRDSRLARLKRRRGITQETMDRIVGMRHAIWERVLAQATEAQAGIG